MRVKKCTIEKHSSLRDFYNRESVAIREERDISRENAIKCFITGINNTESESGLLSTINTLEEIIENTVMGTIQI